MVGAWATPANRRKASLIAARRHAAAKPHKAREEARKLRQGVRRTPVDWFVAGAFRIVLPLQLTNLRRDEREALQPLPHGPARRVQLQSLLVEHRLRRRLRGALEVVGKVLPLHVPQEEPLPDGLARPEEHAAPLPELVRLELRQGALRGRLLIEGDNVQAHRPQVHQLPQLRIRCPRASVFRQQRLWRVGHEDGAEEVGRELLRRQAFTAPGGFPGLDCRLHLRHCLRLLVRVGRFFVTKIAHRRSRSGSSSGDIRLGSKEVSLTLKATAAF
mmetsp:Transcript_121230/g.354370  ORF Transcript_121230/g.354370 Transcript_121230/m.354370 type:complete len:273 (-) Transcript_121230:1-819(-)